MNLWNDFFDAGMHWRIINFSLFVGMLVYFLRQPLRNFWSSRAQGVEQDMNESSQLLRQAEEENRALVKRVNELEQEVTRLIKSMEEEGELERNKMLEETDKVVQRIRQDAQKIAEQEIRRARESLKAETVNLAVELAEKIIREKIQDQDQGRLRQKYLDDLSQSQSASSLGGVG